MAHTLKTKDLENFESSILLASSSKESKRISIVCRLSDGLLLSHFLVKKNEATLYYGGSLLKAIECYNEIN